MAAYDKNVDYSDLIAAEAAKGVNADRQLLAELEAARNAKISGENLNYAQTNVYTQELGSPPALLHRRGPERLHRRDLRRG